MVGGWGGGVWFAGGGEGGRKLINFSALVGSMLYSLEYENELIFASVLICCHAMQQLTAHVPSQIGLAKFESLLGLTPIMAN